MRTIWFLAVLLGLLLGAGAARGDEPSEAGAVLDRAIEAAGGAANLSRFRAFAGKVKGTIHDGCAATPYTGEWLAEPPDRQRLALVGGRGPNQFRVVAVVNGARGWVTTDDGPAKDMDKKMLADAREALYASHVIRLAPLKGKGFRLKLLGDSKVGNRAAVGLEVTSVGHRPLLLFFDKTTWLLLKSEGRSRDPDSGKEVTEETLYENYRDVQGARLPMKTTTKEDGKPGGDLEFTELKLLEKLDDRLFARPAKRPDAAPPAREAKSARTGPAAAPTDRVIPVQPWVIERVQEKYIPRNDHRTPILPAIRPGQRLRCDDPPDRAAILRALPRLTRGIPCVYEESRDNVAFTVKKLVDRIDPPRFYPLIGPAQLHHCHYKCTLRYTLAVRLEYPVPLRLALPRVETVYIDRDHLHVYDGPKRVVPEGMQGVRP
jgi:hypothetical protein